MKPSEILGFLLMTPLTFILVYKLIKFLLVTEASLFLVVILCFTVGVVILLRSHGKT